MSEDNVSGYDRAFGHRAELANSDEAEFDRLATELGAEPPAVPVPVPIPLQGASVARSPQSPNVSRETSTGSRSSDATDAIAQFAGGVADIASNVANFGQEMVHAFDGVLQRGELSWTDLRADQKVDFGGMISEEPITPEQHTTRSVGKFLGQAAAFFAGGEIAAVGEAGTVVNTISKLGGAGLTNAVAFDPHEEGLSDMMQRTPMLRNAVTDYLAQDPNDSQGTKRFKNFLGGALGEGLGMAAFNMYSMYKGRRLMRAGAEVAEDIPVRPGEQPPPGGAGGERVPAQPEAPKDYFATTKAAQEGYTLEYQGSDKGLHTIIAKDKNGELVGQYKFVEDGDSLNPLGVGTDPTHQRKGLANSAYVLAEQKTGKVISPEPLADGIKPASSDVKDVFPAQTDDARAMWAQENRPFGNKQAPVLEGQAASIDPPPLADEAKLAAAEQTPGATPPGGGEDAPILKDRRGAPVGNVLPKAGPVESSRMITGNLTEEEFNRISKEINLTKMSDEEQQALFREVETGLNDVRVVPKTDAQRVAWATRKAVTDPAYVENLRLRGRHDPTDWREVTMSSMLREANLVAMKETRAALAVPGLAPEATAALQDKKIAALLEWKTWAGISANTASNAGQALSAARGAGMTEAGAKLQGALMANADRVKFNIGSKETAVATADRLLAMADDPNFVQASSKMASSISKLTEQGVKFGDAVQSYYVESLLSNPKTFLLVNPVSQFVKIVDEVDSQVWTNRAASLSKKAGLNDGVVVTEELLAKEFGTTVSEIRAGNGPSDEAIAAWRKFKNFQATTPEARELLEAKAITRLYHAMRDDAYGLQGLAVDGKFIAGGQEKFGAVSRTMKAEELASAGWIEKLEILAGQVWPKVRQNRVVDKAGKSTLTAVEQNWVQRVAHTPSQTMAVGDAVMGAAASRMEHHSVAMRYALSSENPAMYDQMYNEAMNNPPEWMRKQVIDMMDRANFTTEITKETNPFLYRVKDLVNSNRVTRGLVPFTTVNINAVSQALERVPVIAPALSARTRSALAEGGLARDQALGRMMMGTELMTFGASLYAAGVLTGRMPQDNDARQAFLAANPGFQEHALKIGNTYISTKVLEGPFKNFKFSAELAQIYPYLTEEHSKREWQDLLLAGAAMTMDQYTPDFLIEENAKITNVIRDPDSDEAKKWLAQKLSSPLTPGFLRFPDNVREAVGIPNKQKRIDADKTQDSSDILEMALNNAKRSWGFDDGLADYVNIFGDRVDFQVPMTGPETVSPIFGSKSANRDVENEIVKLGMANPFFRDDKPEGDNFLNLQMPKKTLQLEGVSVPLSPKQYNTYVKLAAGDMSPLVEPGLMTKQEAAEATKNNMRQSIYNLIKTPEYNSVSEKDKKTLIRDIVKNFRSQAKLYMFQIDTDLQLRHQIQGMDNAEASLPPGADYEPQRQSLQAAKKVLRNSRGINP